MPSAELPARCPVQLGEQISAESVSNVFARISALNLVKGEFETTMEFEARSGSAAIDTTQPIAVHTIYSPENSTYNADRAILEIQIPAWNNFGIGWSGTKWSSSFQNLGSKESAHAIMPSMENREVGTYEGQNAYGVSAVVTKIERTRYSVFDRRRKPEYWDSAQKRVTDPPTWRFDRHSTFDAPSVKHGTLKVPVDVVDLALQPDEARALKNEIKAVVYFKPKTPFSSTRVAHAGPTRDRPTDITVTDNVLVGDLLCVALTDASGKVLKIVDTAY